MTNVKINYSGPFFTSDPTKTFAQNVGVMLRQMAIEGREEVMAKTIAHRGDMPYWTGYSYGQITSRVHSPWEIYKKYRLVWPSTFGAPGRLESRASGSKASMTSGREQFFRGNAAAIIMAASSSIEGRWHPYRETKNLLNRSRAANQAELAKGLE